MVVHLLVLGRVVAHEGTPGEHEVGACRIETLVDEEVFLFPSEVGLHLLHLRIEIVAYCCGSHVNGM